MYRSVFITGASGFIGRALAERFRAMGATVRGMDLKADPANDVVAGDLTRPESWRAHAAGCELFVNTAAVVSNNAPWDLYRQVSVHGVRNALDVAAKVGATRFVQYSSVAALGWDTPDPVDETWPTVIGEQYRYGVAKGASEHLVLSAHASGVIPCTIVRPTDVYGPGSRAWLVEPLKLVRAKTLVLPDHGNGRFSPVYIDDLLDGTVLAATRPEGAGQVFIVGGGYSVSCQEFFGYHWRWAGRTGKVSSVSLPLALRIAGAIQRFNRIRGKSDETCPDSVLMLARHGGYSIDKARRLLGYEPKVTLEDGMQRSERWLREIGELR
jgi:nucleoside-diphosphate-sugar epimerase